MRPAHPAHRIALMPLMAAALLVSGHAKPNVNGPYTPLQVLRPAELGFPSLLALREVDEGEARVMIMVEADGKLRDWMVTGYSHPLFAKEALDSLPTWKYEPATFHGQPISTRTELHFQFKREGIIRVIPGDVESARRMAKDRRRDAFWQRVCEVQELDAVPEAVVEVMPEPPDKLGAVQREGRVVVDYFIDPEGKVRMPLIVRSDDEAFSAAVLLAITEWRYTPPRKQGVPVMTRVWRQFDFKPAQTVAKG